MRGGGHGAHGGRKQEGEGQVGQPGEAALERALAQRRGEVVILAGVVHMMRRPQQVALVARPVEAVVAWTRAAKLVRGKWLRMQGRKAYRSRQGGREQ
jgi:surface antigen